MNYLQIPMMKIPKTLSDILTREEISAILGVCTNAKHKALLLLAYGSGLRTGEIEALRVKDIDSVKMRIFVRGGKNRRDRYTILPQNITFRELQKFQERSDPPVVRAFEKISDYMNEHLFDLSFQAEKAKPEELKVICRDILEQSKIRYQLESPRETELFLAAINGGLMDGQDWIANYFLSQAGHALLGEPTEISIPLE